MIDIKLLKYISLIKLINLLKIYLGYTLSVLFKRPFVYGYPYSLTIEPTNNCNLHCVECPTGNKESARRKGNLKFSLYKKIIDKLRSHLIYQMLYFQGEPFLNPDIFKMIKYADNNKIYTGISTNGHFLSPANNLKIIRSGLKKIIISIDGTTQGIYEKYRVGGDLSKVITGVKDLVLTRKAANSKYPYIIIQFLVLKTNEHQMNEIIDLSKTLGADKIEFKSAQIENFESDLMPYTEKFSRYRRIDDKIIIKNKLKNRCLRIWSTIVISWDGVVIPCCFDKGIKHPLGIVTKKDVTNQWKSRSFNQFRSSILLNRNKIPMCTNCTEGLSIKN